MSRWRFGTFAIWLLIGLFFVAIFTS